MARHWESARERLGELQPRIRPDGSVRVSRERRLAALALAAKPLDPGRIGSFRHELGPREIRAFEREAGDVLAELGYPVEYTARRRPTVRRQLRRVPRAPRKLARSLTGLLGKRDR